MIDAAKYRRSFPILKTHIQLSSCSQSALHEKVSASIEQYLYSWQTEGMDWGTWMDACEQARQKFARMINAQPEEVAIVSSVSHAVSAVATSLNRISHRNKIVMTEADFPCVGHVWLSQSDLDVSFVKTENGEITLDQYQQAITPDTLVTSVPHVSYYNGFKQDLAEIAKLAHEKGSYLFVDAYQSAGQTPIDVRGTNIDFLTTGMQKYMLGIPGLAFLYIKKDVADLLTPKITGWFGQQNPFTFDVKHIHYAEGARRFDTGTFPMINGYAANAALDVLLEVGIENIDKHLQKLSRFSIDYACDQGLVVTSPKDPKRKGSNTSIRVNDAAKVEEKMKQNRIIVSARNDVIRIAPHFYNDENDIKTAIDTLRKIVS